MERRHRLEATEPWSSCRSLELTEQARDLRRLPVIVMQVMCVIRLRDHLR